MKLVIILAAVLFTVGCGKDKNKPAAKDPPPSPKQVAKKPPPKNAPSNPSSAAAIEAGIRAALGKPTDELTAADFEQVTSLYLPHDGIDDLRSVAQLTNLEELSVWNNQIKDLTPLAGLKKLKEIIIYDNPGLTRTEIDKLRAALPGCVIRHNSKKF